MDKTLLVAVHKGTYSETDALTGLLMGLHNDFNQKGLLVFEILTTDDQGRTTASLVLEYSYAFKLHLGIEYQVLADGGGQTVGSFFTQEPLVLLLDKAGVIRFRQEGQVPSKDRLRTYVDTLVK